MGILVSIIIPVYNAEKYLEECVGSIVQSSVFENIEVLLIDDGSTDASGEICNRFSGKYNNLKTFHLKNCGVSNARNFGVLQSNGEYITFCDADDYYVCDIFEKALPVLQTECPDLLFYNFVNEQNNSSEVKYPFAGNETICDMNELFRFMLGSESFNSVWNKFYKASVISKEKLEFEFGKRYGEDRNFVLRFLSKARSAYYLPETGYFYRYVKTSAVNKSRTDYFDNIADELMFKQKISSKFNLLQSEVEKAIEKSAVKSIISSVFTASENSFASYLKAVKKLVKNKQLMSVLCANSDVEGFDCSQKEVFDLISTKHFLMCFVYIKYLKLKEYIYKLIQKRGKI